MRPTKYVFEALGYAVTGYEEDYFEQIGPNGEWMENHGITDLLHRAGADVLTWSERTAFRYAGRPTEDQDMWAEERAAYRMRTGRDQIQPPVNVRITVEILDDKAAGSPGPGGTER